MTLPYDLATALSEVAVGWQVPHLNRIFPEYEWILDGTRVLVQKPAPSVPEPVTVKGRKVDMAWDVVAPSDGKIRTIQVAPGQSLTINGGSWVAPNDAASEALWGPSPDIAAFARFAATLGFRPVKI